MHGALTHTDLPFPVRRGKVRDVYDLGDRLLIVATDRISAFDCVLSTGIPGKGRLLTQMSNFWFAFAADRLGDVRGHLVEVDVSKFPAELQPFRDLLVGRSVLAHKADVIPIECVARGYLAGSGLKEYQRSRTVCGIALPAGLELASKLPRPIFTPATKADEGHDENVSFERAGDLVGLATMQTLRDVTLELYTAAADYAMERGIILADTKFEFGRLPDGSLMLIDEVLTPDSSRFWDADRWQPGASPASFDKQFVRDWLEGSGWDKTPPAPPLPPNVVVGTQARYEEALRRLTGPAA